MLSQLIYIFTVIKKKTNGEGATCYRCNESDTISRGKTNNDAVGIIL